MTIGGIVLVANWFLEGKFIEKWNRLKNNRILFASLCLFAVYFIWFFLTDNYQEAWKDIWMKTPFLFMPIIFASSQPLSRIEINHLLKVYLIGLLISSVYGMLVFQLDSHLIDKREIAVFISYIRFEMNLCFAIAVAVYLIFQKEEKICQVFTLILFNVVVLSCFYIGALTAIILLVSIGVLLILKKVVETKNRFYRITLPLVFFAFIATFVVYTTVLIKQYYTVDFVVAKADKYTAEGNLYTHNIEHSLIENGSYVLAYVCEDELRSEWNKRSTIDFEDRKKTLIRYLNSKGLRKDKAGVLQLSDEDIRHIEKGVANVVYLDNFGFKARLYGLLWELSDYNKSKKVSGYTLPQRFEL